MRLTERQLNEVIEQCQRKLMEELVTANQKGRIDDCLEKHNFVSIKTDECAHCFVEPYQKILIIGDIRFDKSYIKEIAEDYGIDSSLIEIYDEYERIPNYDFDKLFKSKKYSDIIVGAIPHKTKGTHGSSGILAYMKHNQNKIPNLVIASTGNELKLTLNTFKRALEKTRYYAYVCM